MVLGRGLSPRPNLVLLKGWGQAGGALPGPFRSVGAGFLFRFSLITTLWVEMGIAAGPLGRRGPGGARPPIEALVLYIITTLIDYLVSHLL